MADSAKNLTVKGTLWSMVERFSTIGIQLLCTLVIAQFLSPGEFGLISMMSIFLAFCTILIDAGFGQAVIRERNVSRLDYSSIFYFNLLIGATLYGIFYVTAPLIADFYSQPRLCILIRISFLGLLIHSLTVVQQARLFKAVDFAKISKISLFAVVLSGIVGIWVAVTTKSVWALVAQTLSFSALRSMLLWIYGRWHPRLEFSAASIRKYLWFSLNLLGTNIIAAITDNLPNLFIGKFYSASVLGNYSIPDKLQRSIAGTLSFSIHRVSYPVMAKFQDDDAHLRAYSQKIVGMAFFIIAPIMMFLWIEAKDLFDLLLPAAWNQAAGYFRYMCFIGAIYCFADINLDVLMVKGKSSWILRIEIVRKLIFVGALFLGITFSIDTLLKILIGYNLFNALFVSYFSGKAIGLTLFRQICNLWKTLLILLLTTCAVWLFSELQIAPILRFIGAVGCYLVIYTVLALMLNSPYISEIISLISKFRGSHS